MIIKLRFKNFRSYRDETSFTMEALPSEYLNCNYSTIKTITGEELRLLNSAAIFGANASGKSNVIWVLHALSEMVRNSRTYDSRTPVPYYYPFVFDDNFIHKPTEISIEFITKGKHFKYDIGFTNLFHHEELSIWNGDSFDLLYRFCDAENGGKSITYGNSKICPTTAVVLDGELYANQLFLSYIGTHPQNEWEDAYEELAYIETEPVTNSINLRLNNENAAARILQKPNSNTMDRLNRLIQISDMGIEKVSVIEHSIDEFRMPVPDDFRKAIFEQNKWEFNVIHKFQNANGVVEERSIPMLHESTGTKSLFGVGSRVLNVLENGGILAYDEMNVALHPELFLLIVSLFNNMKSNPHGAQLIFTTHDASIAREGVLRADQVWFAEKNNDCMSDLYSAQDFDDASINMPFEKWYRAGRFGALPKFGSVDYIFEEDVKKNN